MPKKGTHYLYRVVATREYDNAGEMLAKSACTSAPFHDISGAANAAVELQNIGARVSIGYVPVGKTTRDMTTIQVLDVTEQPPTGYRLCPSCGGAFPVDLTADDGRTVKPFTTHAVGGRFGQCETEIDPDEVEEAYRHNREVTPVAWAVAVDGPGGSESHVYDSDDDARNQTDARAAFVRAAQQGQHVRLVKAMRRGKNILVDERPRMIPGDFFTPGGVKAHAFYVAPDKLTTIVTRRHRDAVAVELEKILADPASFTETGAIDPVALTLRIKELRGL